MIPIRRRLYQSLAGFSPRQLFAALQGAWLEPVVGSIWQENTGVTPTTTGGQTIGLMLDQSQGAVLGPELVTVSSVSGLPAGGGTRIYSTGAVLSANRHYLIKATVTDFSGTSTVGFSTSSGVLSSTLSRSSNGLLENYRLTVLSGTLNLFTLDTNTANFSNISVREILGNHAFQATASARPTLQFNGELPLARFDTNDSLTLSLPSTNVRRNLLTYSEQFDNAAWTTSNASIAPNVELAPNGTATADKLVENSATSLHYISQYTVTSGLTYAISFYAKPAGRNFVYITNIGAGTCYFNLGTGAVAAQGSFTSASMQNVGNGWYRCIGIAVAGGAGTMRIGPAATSSSLTYAGDGTSGIYIWGAQLELGSVATDYQKITDWTSEAYSSNGSVYFATPVGMSQLNNQSMGTTYTLPALSSDIYAWMVFPQRLNTAQEARLARYMEQRAGLVAPDYFEQVDYGPELVVNGDFSNGTTGWKGSADGTNQDDSILSIASGALRITNNTAGNITPRVRQTSVVTVAAGKYYVVSLRVVSNPNNVPLALTYSVSDSPSGFAVTGNAATGTSGTLAATFVAYSNSYFSPGFRLNSAVLTPGQYVEINNISVRELKDGMTGQLTDDAGDLILMAQ